MSQNRVYCYCAFCKNPRYVFRRKSIRLKSIVQALCLSGGLSFLLWKNILDPRGLVVFVSFFMMFELFSIFRARMELTCPHCGFDAVLYKKNHEAACAKVRKHLETRQNDPAVWLAQKPPLRFAKRKNNKHSTREIVA